MEWELNCAEFGFTRRGQKVAFKKIGNASQNSRVLQSSTALFQHYERLLYQDFSSKFNNTFFPTHLFSRLVSQTLKCRFRSEKADEKLPLPSDWLVLKRGKGRREGERCSIVCPSEALHTHTHTLYLAPKPTLRNTTLLTTQPAASGPSLPCCLHQPEREEGRGTAFLEQAHLNKVQQR